MVNSLIRYLKCMFSGSFFKEIFLVKQKSRIFYDVNNSLLAGNQMTFMEEGAFVTEKGRKNSGQNEEKNEELETVWSQTRIQKPGPHEKNDYEKILEQRICNNMEEDQRPQLPPGYMTKAKFFEFKT